MAEKSTIAGHVPADTIEWLTQPDNPAVAVMTRRGLLGEPESRELMALWERRNEYPPVARILELQNADGTWMPPARDYKKYQGSLWQVHLLGELYADGSDERVARAAEYAFSRQLDDGSWSCNGRPSESIPCLTANVGRALARLGFARDERISAALAYVAGLATESGAPVCSAHRSGMTLNGYCHMLAPKALLFLAEIPRDLWPSEAESLRDLSVAALRDKEVFRCLPKVSGEFQTLIWETPPAERPAVRDRFVAEHEPLEYGPKPGWLRLGYPLSYNSDALESLLALAAVGETRRPEYEPALAAVRDAADSRMRWSLRTTHNGKMLADVEIKGQPSKWLTWRALKAFDAFDAFGPPAKVPTTEKGAR